jgi:protein-S-isoprenylcysteine O-methyltransferase Ste14
MQILGWIGRGVFALLGLLLAADVAGVLYLALTHRLTVTPGEATTLMWNTWLVSWIAAMLWSRQVAARPPLRDELMHWTPTVVGAGLLWFGSAATHFTPLWRTSDAAAWGLSAVCGAGLLFTWWARVSLGSLWSGSVSRKQDHAVVQGGPYRLVRHPIYTGLIVAAFASAAVVGQTANLAGAALMTLGFWLKARLEERFLSQQLGPAAYNDYRRRTPMLVPFWPA